jgi:hypothetical protein
MVIEPAYGDEIRATVQSIRSLSGQDDIDLLWNRRLNKWIVVQRLSEAKLPIDALIVDCLEHPDRPPAFTNLRSLFRVEFSSGGYMNPAAHPITIADRVRIMCPRNAEGAWEQIEQSKRAAKAAEARATEEWRQELEDVTAHAVGREVGEGQHSIIVP